MRVARAAIAGPRDRGRCRPGRAGDGHERDLRARGHDRIVGDDQEEPGREGDDRQSRQESSSPDASRVRVYRVGMPLVGEGAGLDVRANAVAASVITLAQVRVALRELRRMLGDPEQVVARPAPARRCQARRRCRSSGSAATR